MSMFPALREAATELRAKRFMCSRCKGEGSNLMEETCSICDGTGFNDFNPYEITTPIHRPGYRDFRWRRCYPK